MKQTRGTPKSINIYRKTLREKNTWKKWRTRENGYLYRKVSSRLGKPRSGSSFFCDDGDENTGFIRNSEILDKLSKILTEQGSLVFTYLVVKLRISL